MTTTPEQLQAWREKFCTAFNIRLWELTPSGNFSSVGLAREWAGYLRRCQETEQAIKDVHKQALEDAIAICNATCDPHNTEHGNGYNRAALDCEKKIKVLLND